MITLSHFSQSIYLLFSAVYVLKESVEHVLMLHGPNEADGSHGSGHGGMGHGEGLASSSSSNGFDGYDFKLFFSSNFTEVSYRISLPVVLLLLSALFSIISAIAFRNHQKLSEAVGPSRLSRATSNFGPLEALLNPFTSTILLFSVGLAVSAFTIPGFVFLSLCSLHQLIDYIRRLQLAPLDKVVALLQSFAMFYIAYPAAVSTGQVLLQTAPPASAKQMGNVSNGLREVS